MKVIIEVINANEAMLVIDGRALTVKRKGIATALHGVETPETEDTIGGLVAAYLLGPVSRLLDVKSKQRRSPTWNRLTDSQADDISDSLF